VRSSWARSRRTTRPASARRDQAAAPLSSSTGANFSGLCVAQYGKRSPSSSPKRPAKACALEWWRRSTLPPRTCEGTRTFTPSLREEAGAAAVAAGDRWLLLPHAFAFVDPMFSTGIAWSLAGVELARPTRDDSSRIHRGPSSASRRSWTRGFRWYVAISDCRGGSGMVVGFRTAGRVNNPTPISSRTSSSWRRLPLAVVHAPSGPTHAHTQIRPEGPGRPS